MIGLLAVSTGLLVGAASWAQVSSVPQSCSPPPVANAQLPGTSRKVIVERIEFDRTVHLSNSVIEQVIEKANNAEWDANSPAWIDELAEIELRSAWQDRGYFKIALDPHAQSIGADSGRERFLVTVHVINEGLQYHLGDIRFTGDTAIPEAELRQTFPLHEGEFFDVARVREGIEALTKLYGSHGYIDFTVTPDTEINDNLQRISLVMLLDPQKQFRVGSVEIQGLGPSLEASLRSIVMPGEVFNPQPIETFLRENRPVLPSRGFDNFQIRRNVRAGIVDLTFDPRFCRDSE
jgi:outer membrane protein assembly factor BamA